MVQKIYTKVNELHENEDLSKVIQDWPASIMVRHVSCFNNLSIYYYLIPCYMINDVTYVDLFFREIARIHIIFINIVLESALEFLS